MTTDGGQACVLCVDDEPYVLDGLSLHLRRRYQVITATSGATGLDLLARSSGVSAIVSDMRMPGMDGATFLKAARQIAPDTTRLLLTGHADIGAAVAAINEGQIFRFLSKPCAPAEMLTAVEAAVNLQRLVTREQVLLEQTLAGSIKVLTDVLALASPIAFGRATRVKRLVSDMAEQLQLKDRWQLELAAMFSQIGAITLPAETAEKLHYGRSLSPDEQSMVARLPEVTRQLLGHIPRLEAVGDIVERAGGRPRTPAESKATLQYAEILRLALDFDTLESEGNPAVFAVGLLRARADRYDAEALEALARVRDRKGVRDELRELPIAGLRAGMTFADDVMLANGTMLVARGYEITAGFLQRIRNFTSGTIREPARVVIKAYGSASARAGGA